MTVNAQPAQLKARKVSVCSIGSLTEPKSPKQLARAFLRVAFKAGRYQGATVGFISLL